MADERDIQDIINTLIAEGVGEGEEGMRRIAETILNRAEQRGISPAEVVRQRAQYTGYSAPGPAAVKAQRDPSAIRAAQAAWQLAQGPDDPTGGANHYWNPNIVTPSWAGSMTTLGQYGNHAFATDHPVPPGEIPNTVGTALSTVPTPRNAPAPVTPSVDLAMYRRNVAPSQLVPDTFASLNKPRRTLGDELAMSPVQGGQQQAPMFDGIYDERIGAVRPSGSPIDTQGMATMRSREPAPVPRMPSPQLAARRATDPVLQAALNARYAAQLPPLPPPMNASPVGKPPTTRVVQSVPMGGTTGVGSMPTFAQLGATLGKPLAPEDIPSLYADVFPRPLAPPSSVPANPNADFSVAIVDNTVGPNGKRTTSPVVPRFAPTPFARPTQFAQAPRIAPVPFQRPTGVGTALSVRPMPPMPIPRPAFGMGGGERPAPVPARMSPVLAMRRSLPVLRPAASPAATRVWMTGFSDSESSGGAHGGSTD